MSPSFVLIRRQMPKPKIIFVQILDEKTSAGRSPRSELGRDEANAEENLPMPVGCEAADEFSTLLCQNIGM